MVELDWGLLIRGYIVLFSNWLFLNLGWTSFIHQSDQLAKQHKAKWKIVLVNPHLQLPNWYVQAHISGLKTPCASFSSYFHAVASLFWPFETHNTGSNILDSYRSCQGVSSWQEHHIHKELAFWRHNQFQHILVLVFHLSLSYWSVFIRKISFSDE